MTGRILSTVGRRVGGLHRATDGQVTFLMLFGMLVLAGLIFFVFNTGVLINESIEVQNGADAAAVGGALWLARGYNVIAANNVTTARLLAATAILEALEPAVELARPNADAIEPVLRQYASGALGTAITEQMLATYQQLHEEAVHCQQILAELSDLLAGLDDKYAGFPEYFTAFEDGAFWVAMRGLQDFSQAMVELAPIFAQERAMIMARRNGAERGVLVPIHPDVPVVQGRWEDFEPQVRAQWNELVGSVFGGTRDELRLSGFPWILKRIAAQKLNAVLNKNVEAVYIPRWTTDWQEALEKHAEVAASAGRRKVVLSLWPYTQRRRPYASRDRQFGPTGEPPYLSDEGEALARDRGVWLRWLGSPARRQAPGRDPVEPNHQVLQRQDWQQVGTWVWRFQDQQRTPDPFHIGALPGSPPDGYYDADQRPPRRPYWDYWQWQVWSFGGALIDEEEYLPQENERLRGDKQRYFPLLLAGSAGPDTRWGPAAWRVWEVLGFAWSSSSGRVWTKVFQNPNPTQASMAFAQARIYNPAAWDLWSQHWRVKLVPATHLLDVDTGRFDTDYEAYRALGSALSAEDFEPIRRLYERLPAGEVAGALFDYADNESRWRNRPVVNH